MQHEQRQPATNEQAIAISQDHVNPPSEEFQSLLNRFIAENDGAVQRYRAGCGVGWLLFMVAFVGLGVLIGRWTEGREPGWLTSSANILCWGAAYFVATRVAVSRAQKDTLKALGRFDDLRMIGPLIDALDYATGKTRRDILSILDRLLSRAPLDRVPQLTDAQLSRLCTILASSRPERDADLMCGILDLLAIAGNRNAVRSARRLTKLGPLTPERARVMEVAQRCLAKLEERFDPLRPSDSLLRAAEQPELPNQGLLAPAQASPQQATETLLRPTQQEDRA